MEYCWGRAKRALDLALVLASLILLLPLFVLLCLAVLLTSGRPVLFAQERIGARGRPFRLYKLRTMRASGTPGLPLTGSGDPRVTRLGRLLRAAKLDELPQLWNVLRGQMSIVGPRPEVPRYVAQYTREQQRVLETRPGLTDPASVLFRDEEALVGSVPEGQRERLYLEVILPKKLSMNLEYIERASLIYDLVLILKTLQAIVRPAPPRLT